MTECVQETIFNVGKWNAEQREAERETEREAARRLLKNYNPPTMESVVLAELRVDEKYQRTLSDAKVHMLRANFSPNACQPLAISHRADGSRYLVDGQHRAKTLMDIGLREWLGLVYRNLSRKDEAAMWEEVNTRQTKPQPIFRFRALAIKRDSETVAIIGIVTGAGLSINFDRAGKGKGAGMRILAVTALQKIFRQRKGPGLADVLKVLQDAWPDPDDSQRVSSPILLGLGAFLGGTWKSSIDLDRAAKALGKLGPEKWLAKIHGAGVSSADDLARHFRDKYNSETRGRSGRL